ncbi:MAG: chromosomal replication initiator protein DnaA [Phycisphaerales bacterium]|jgi:chromosomal replication initiator protein|nr:chromosomal replication initiator protein DnaA [Phycisphaerales bacterium]
MDTAVTSSCAGNATQQIYKTLREELGARKYNAWFKHGTRITLEAEHVKIAVPNPFVANWIEGHYCSDVEKVAENQTGMKRPVIVTIDAGLAGETKRNELDAQADLVHKSGAGQVRRPVNATKPQTLGHKLDNFVIGKSNKLAYSAALAMAGVKAPPFSTLFVHGSCGVGKTHLLQGVCMQASRIHHRGSPLTWKYVTCEQFTNEFIQSLRAKNIAQFRARYRKLDLLAIDDVHFLSGKKATQDEFLHTFNAIETAGRRIVLASDAHPHMVGSLNEQLISRFASGMVVKVDPPDAETRMSILMRKAMRMKLGVEKDVLEYIANHIHGSVRELEGALTKLAALSALEGTAVGLDLARSSLADHLAKNDSAVTLGDIEASVCAFFGITPADVHSSRRTKTVSTARMLCFFLARRHTQMSYPEIAQALGKNHSSAVLAVQRLQKVLDAGDELKWTGPMGAKSMLASRLVEMLSEQFN